jgi:hypothetical protein
MKLKTKLRIDGGNICIFFNHDIFFSDVVYSMIKEFEDNFRRKPLTKNTAIEFHQKFISILNVFIASDILSLWKREGLCNVIKKDKDFGKIPCPIIATQNIIKPINHVFLTGGVSWN